MKKHRQRVFVKMECGTEDATRIPPWWYTGCDVIILDEDEWREITPEEDTIPA